MQLSPASVIGVSSDQVAASLDGETVILSISRGRYFGVDTVGSRVWALIQSPIPVSAVVRTVAAEFDVSPERCETDLLQFLERLVDAGLAEVQSAETP